MEEERLIEFLRNITELSGAFVTDLLSVINHEYYKARQIIHAEGQPESRLWYVCRGLARSYIYDSLGQQHTMRFWNANDIIFSYAGFLNTPSKEYIDIVAESALLSCSYTKLEQLMTDHSEMVKIAGAITARHQQQEYKKSELHSLKTKERYQLFKAENPQVFKMAPLWMIASYLHMTRENLSRVISEE